MAMFNLWQSKQIVRMGYQITSLEEKKVTLEERNRRLESQINTLRSPENILRHLDDMNLELLPPGEEMEESIFTAGLKNKKGP
jgi:hypothetical protein